MRDVEEGERGVEELTKVGEDRGDMKEEEEEQMSGDHLECEKS